jgi:hypothetical protein
MNYRVRWLTSVEQDLAQIWIEAQDRNRITAAADQIDQVVGRDPLSFGESHGGQTRIGIMAPLAILFDVDAVNRRVTIWDIWRWREKSEP